MRVDACVDGGVVFKSLRQQLSTRPSPVASASSRCPVRLRASTSMPPTPDGLSTHSAPCLHGSRAFRSTLEFSHS